MVANQSRGAQYYGSPTRELLLDVSVLQGVSIITACKGIPDLAESKAVMITIPGTAHPLPVQFPPL